MIKFEDERCPECDSSNYHKIETVRFFRNRRTVDIYKCEDCGYETPYPDVDGERNERD